jgi:hypothetical protein
MRRIHARADTARPVREHVQRLNLARGLAGEMYEDENTHEHCAARDPPIPAVDDACESLRISKHAASSHGARSDQRSRWASYVTKTGLDLSTSPAEALLAKSSQVDTNIEFITALPDAMVTKCGRSKRNQENQLSKCESKAEGEKRPKRDNPKFGSRRRGGDKENEHQCASNSHGALQQIDSQFSTFSQRHRKSQREVPRYDDDGADDITLVAPGRDEVVEDDLYF